MPNARATVWALLIVGIAGAGRAHAAPADWISLYGPPATGAPRAAGQDAPPAPPAPAPSGQEKRWSSFLPLLADEARARGHVLPLPFGVGATVTFLGNRDIEVEDLRIAVNGAPPTSVSQFVDLGSTSDVFNVNAKFDVWLLPFLNVYALLGYVYNESDTNVAVSVPRPGPLPGTIESAARVKTKLEGFVGGGGLTLAAGYKEFFLVADGNYSQTDIGFDDRFRAVVGSLRAGYQSKLGDLNCQFWLGASYWNTYNTARGHTVLPDGTRLDFEADQGPEVPWFLDIGANIRFHAHFEMAVDVGVDFDGGFLVSVVPVLRF